MLLIVISGLVSRDEREVVRWQLPQIHRHWILTFSNTILKQFYCNIKMSKVQKTKQNKTKQKQAMIIRMCCSSVMATHT